MKFISIPCTLPNETKFIDIEKIVFFVYNEKINHTLNISFSGGHHIMVNGEFARKLYNYLMMFNRTEDLEGNNHESS